MLARLFNAVKRMANSAESIAGKLETVDAGLDGVFGTPQELVSGGVVSPPAITQEVPDDTEASVAVIEPVRTKPKRKVTRKKKALRRRR